MRDDQFGKLMAKMGPFDYEQIRVMADALEMFIKSQEYQLEMMEEDGEYNTDSYYMTKREVQIAKAAHSTTVGEKKKWEGFIEDNPDRFEMM